MNLMDNAQMTSQLAQINTVSGIQQPNETMKSMATQLTALQALQGTAMIGHDACQEQYLNCGRWQSQRLGGAQ